MNKKIYPIGFFLMLAINIALISFIALSPSKTQHERKRGMKDHIGSQLGLSDEQKATFEQMVKNHRLRIRDIELQERALIGTYFKNLTVEEPISSDSVLAEINTLKKQRIQITYQHLEDLKSLCNEEQLEKFDTVLQRIIPMLTGSPGRRIKRPSADR